MEIASFLHLALECLEKKEVRGEEGTTKKTRKGDAL
jgi:hypothetical protein